MPIDAALWIRNRDEDNHRPGAIEGYCENIHKGRIRVAINIGNCPGRGDSDGYTGWNSVSRLIIEEVPKPQWLLSLVSCVSLCGNGSIIGCKWAKVVICKGFLPFFIQFFNLQTCNCNTVQWFYFVGLWVLNLKFISRHATYAFYVELVHCLLKKLSNDRKTSQRAPEDPKEMKCWADRQKCSNLLEPGASTSKLF